MEPRLSVVEASHSATPAELAESLARAAAESPDEAIHQLEQLQARNPALAMNVVAALGRSRRPEAGRALAAVAASRLGKELRKEARRGLHRLRAAGLAVPEIQPPVLEVPARPQAKATVADAWGSMPDSAGTRVLYVAADRPSGGILRIGLLLNDVVGLKAARFDVTTRKRFDAFLRERLEEAPRLWARLPVDYAGQLVGEALELNKQGGLPVPRDFQLNQDQVEGLVRPFEGALIYREISAGAARLAPDWLQHSPELLQEPGLETWFFNFDDVRNFAHRWQEARAARLLLAPQAAEEREELVLSEAIRQVVAPLRLALKRRLEEAAYLFARTDRPRQARLAVAAAVGLEEAGVSPLLVHQPQRRLDQHPLVRVMMERSLEMALRIEATGEGYELMRSRPTDPFDAS